MRGLFHWDLDGCVSEIVLSKFINFDKTYACGYSKIDKFIKTIKPNEAVIISDVSLDVTQVENILKKTSKFYIIDHHPNTAILVENYSDKVYFSKDFCGAELCRQLCQKRFPEKYTEIWTPEMSKLVKLTDTYDLWKTESDVWNEAYTLDLLYWKYVHWGFVKKFKDGYSLTEQNKDDIKVLLKKKSQMIEDAETFDIGDKVMVALCDRDVTNDFTLIHKTKYDLYFMISTDRGELILSIRSTRDDKDLTPILNMMEEYDPAVASAGGHARAGGVSFNERTSMEDVLLICHHIAMEYKEEK